MRNKLVSGAIVSGTVAAAILVFAFLYISAQNSTTTVEENVAAVAVPFTKIMDGSHAKIDIQVNYLITSTDELKQLWKAMGATSTPPDVDFSRNTVLAVFAGSEANGPITISKIEDGSQRLVSINITEMDASCPKTKLAPAAYEIVAVSSTTLPITHTYTTQTKSCQ
jgi:hypothetical protein